MKTENGKRKRANAVRTRAAVLFALDVLADAAVYVERAAHDDTETVGFGVVADTVANDDNGAAVCRAVFRAHVWTVSRLALAARGLCDTLDAAETVDDENRVRGAFDRVRSSLDDVCDAARGVGVRTCDVDTNAPCPRVDDV